jgi:hypothetical protein
VENLNLLQAYLTKVGSVVISAYDPA